MPFKTKEYLTADSTPVTAIAAQKGECCLDIQEFPLLTASSQMETVPIAGKSWQPSQELPYKREKTGFNHTDKTVEREGRKGVRAY